MWQVPLLWRLRVIHKNRRTSRRPTTRQYLPILTNLPNHAFRDTNKFVQPSQIIIVTHKSSLHSTIIHSYTILYTPYTFAHLMILCIDCLLELSDIVTTALTSSIHVHQPTSAHTN